MNIIIAGCGKVGRTLATRLTNDRHEVTVIDNDYEALTEVTSTVDVMGFQGDCTSIKNQKEAGVKKADLLIAMTDNDERNMLTCLIAKKTGRKCHTIARIRSPQYTEEIGYLKDELGLSMSINPERVAANEIVRLIQVPSALEVDSFAKGRVSLIGIKIPEGSVLDNLAIKDMAGKVGVNALICVREHNGEVVIPNGDVVLHSGDTISVFISMADVRTFLNGIGIKAKKIKNVIIAGCGTIGYYLAKRLIDLRINVKIVDRSRERCEELSELLPKAMIICGDATERRIIQQESFDEMDAVCCLMHQDEANIMLSLYLNGINPNVKIITKVQRSSYENLVTELPVGSIVGTKSITSDYITGYVRSMQNSIGSEVEALYRIMDGRVEALELNVGEDFKFTGIKLKDLKIIKDTLICYINRNNSIIRPGGNDTLEYGDKVLVVTTQKSINGIRDIVKD